MLNDWELRKLAHYIAMELMDGKQPEPPQEKRLVPARKAAEILGISKSQLYRIADSLTHIKGGNGRLMFNAAAIVGEYERLLLTSHRSNDNEETEC